MNRGRWGEEVAERYLVGRGFTVRERNLSARFGELDLVAVKDQVLYVVEVKARQSDRFGSPEEAIDRRKMQRLRRLAEWYLQSRGETGREVRVCCVAVTGDEACHSIAFYDDLE